MHQNLTGQKNDDRKYPILRYMYVKCTIYIEIIVQSMQHLRVCYCKQAHCNYDFVLNHFLFFFSSEHGSADGLHSSVAHSLLDLHKESI